MHRLIDGALRFREEVAASKTELYSQLGKEQTPFALFIACSDSRVVPELLTQRDPGDIFVIRNAGNIIPSYGPTAGGVSASIEYALAVLNIENVVVCGHSDCGAIKAMMNLDGLDKLPAVGNWIKYAAAAKEIVDVMLPDADDGEKLNALVHENVLCQLRNLQTHPVVASRIAAGRLKLFGWVYDIESGGIDTFDVASGRFIPLTGGSEVDATPRSQVSYRR